MNDLIEWLAAQLTAAQQPAEQHPDDAAVDCFAAAMKAKLKKKRQEGRGGWQSMTSEQLSALLHEHVRKGDPVDVANLAMMLHQNGQMIEPPATDSDTIRALLEERDQLAAALEAARMGLRHAVRVWVLSDEITWSEEEIDKVVENIIETQKRRLEGRSDERS